MSHYKPYPEYKDSGVEWIGEVPAQWEVIAAKRLFSLYRRDRHDGSEQLAATQDYGVIPQSEYMDRVGNRVMQALGGLDGFKDVKKNFFVISLRSFEGGIERCHYNGCISPAYTVLKPASSVNPKFFERLLKSPLFIQSLNTVTTGIREGKTITYGQFGEIGLTLPPSYEQSQIATFLDRETTRIDTLIEKKQRFIELLEEKRQAVITQAVTKGLDPDVPMKDSGVKAVGKVPLHWVAAPLRSIMHRKKSLVGSAWQDFKLLSLTKNGVIERDVTENFGKFPESFETYQAVAPDDMVMCLFDIDETPRTVGLSEAHGMITGAYTVFGIDSPAHRDYLYQLFLHLDNVKGLKPYYSGLRKTIRPPKLLSMRIPIPPVEEAEAISDHIRSSQLRFDSLVEKTQRSIELLKERRSALITAAVTGKIDVREEAA